MAIPEDELGGLRDLLLSVPGMTQVRLHTPASAHDPLLDDGAPPALVLQLFFSRITDLEAALAKDGALQALLRAPTVLNLGACEVDQQAMLTRRFPVASADAGLTPPTQCTYLVRYQGPAEDTNLWLADYLNGHPPLMARLPGIRDIEIFTRIDWCGFLPWPRANDMQRNQVVFDNPPALDAALNSPLRAEMREHFRLLPPFSGAVTHFPMLTLSSVPT